MNEWVKKIDPTLAAKILLFGFLAIVVFHLSIIVGLVPFEIVWGGRLETREQMLVFESVSIVINGLVIYLLLEKTGFVPRRVPGRVMRVFMWLLMGLFFLNTIGNLLAETLFERLAFTPVTLISALLFYRLALVPAENG